MNNLLTSVRNLSLLACCLVMILLAASACSPFTKTEVYRVKDSAQGVYTDQEVNYFVYIGSQSHYVFYIDDSKIQYLIKNIPRGRLHINIAHNYFIDKVDQKIKTNLISMYFFEDDANQELIEWAKKNKLNYKDAGSRGRYYYNYQTILPLTIYDIDADVNSIAINNEHQIPMSYETILNPELVDRDPSPIEVKDGRLYLDDRLLFEVVKMRKHGGKRELTYQENVREEN